MTDITWHTEKRRVKDLLPFKDNPRQISKDQLAQLKQSLEKFNYAELIAIQPDNTILAGHMRIKALLQLGRGADEIEVRIPNRLLNDEEAREYVIRSNKNTGEWDWDALGNDWDLNDLHEWGFSADDLGIFLDKEEENGEEKEGETCITCGQKIRKKKK